MFIQTSAAVYYKARSALLYSTKCILKGPRYRQNVEPSLLIRIMVALLYSTKYIPKNFYSKTLEYVSFIDYFQ